MGTRLLLVSPSIVLIAVFVYGLIGWNVKVSLSDWRQAEQTSGWAGLAAYRDLNADPAWTRASTTSSSSRGPSSSARCSSACCSRSCSRKAFAGKASSAPCTSSRWRCRSSLRRLALAHEPGPGDRASGLNVAFDKLGIGFLANDWYLGENWGMAAIAMPAIWALRLHHGPLPRGLPRRSRGAARGSEDGRRQGMARVPARRLPAPAPRDAHGADHPRPHLDKVFDLIVAIGGKQLITQTPAVYMWILIYDAFDYAEGAAIATLLLIGISILVIPYLIYSVRTEQRA